MAVLLWSVWGCTGDADPAVTRHPDPSRYVVDLQRAHHLAKDTPLPDGARPFLQLRGELAHVGELDEPAEYVLGEIRAVSQDRMGHLVILDAHSHSVRYYGSGGRFLFAAGGPGEGPGEFMIPNALALDTAAVYVTDLRALRVTTFVHRDDGLILSGTNDLSALTPYDLCTLGDAIVVHGRDMQDPVSGPLLHVFDQRFQRLASFGEIYNAGHPSIQRGLSVGRVFCLAPDRIVLIPAGLPVVVGYSSDGRTAWTTWFDDFAPFQYVQHPDRIENPIPDGGGNYFAGLAAAPNGWLLVQVGRRTLESIQEGEPWETLDTYALRASDGHGMYLGSEYALLAQVTDTTAVTVREVPYPRLTVHRAETVFPP